MSIPMHQNTTCKTQSITQFITRRRLTHTVFFVVCLGVLLMSGMYRSAEAQEEFVCFEQTGYCMTGRIREFWENNGGLAVFGYPISPQKEERIEDQAFQVQEFERNRLELHPENARPYDVLLGRLGADRLAQQGRDWREFPTSNAQEGCRYFPETGHNVCGVFLQAWRADGLEIDGEPGKTEVENLALFGLPLSPPITEELEGKEYVVQWFERARFESHPLNPPPYDVLFGLLGNEVREFANSSDEDATPTPDEDETSPPDEDEAPTPTPDEPELRRILFASDREGDREIFVMNEDGSNVVNLTDHAGIDSTPAWSPDGSKIAFASERDGNREIYVMNADGSDQVRLTDNSADDWNPVWSPDGWLIAFESDRYGNRDVFVMSRDGTQESNLTYDQADDWNPVWSPDGSKIAFQSKRDANREIYVMNADGSRPRNLSDDLGVDEHPAWSPDGEQIVFASSREGNREIFVMDADGSNVEQLTSHPGHDDEPDWSHDGELILFRSERDGNSEIYVMNADGSGATNITRHRAYDRDASWEPETLEGEESEESEE